MDDLANAINRMVIRQSLSADDVIYSNIQRDRSCDLSPFTEHFTGLQSKYVVMENVSRRKSSVFSSLLL